MKMANEILDVIEAQLNVEEEEGREKVEEENDCDEQAKQISENFDFECGYYSEELVRLALI
jgi:hypothetical protein